MSLLQGSIHLKCPSMQVALGHTEDLSFVP